MALGFGFNKAKVLSAAEKHVQQGKLQNAISEYEKVAREDPKDLTVLNTIGDLHARLGQVDRAMAFFRKVGDAYAADGFTVKAIAMYKKLTKLAPHSVEGLQKLAELYTQQGLYNDARQQYVALADHWMKANDLEGAARVFQKMLELDPENAAMQTKLADLYIRMGKKDHAKDIYFRAADSLYQRSALDAADEALGRILAMDSANPRALLTRGLIAVDSGDPQGAIRYLERIPNMESNAEAIGVLMRAHLLAHDQPSAEAVARQLAAQYKDLSGIQALAESLMATGTFHESLALYREFSGQLSVSNSESLQHALQSALQRVADDAPSLEILRELYRKLDDKPHVFESTELLAHALVHAGELKRARDLYRELADTEPENPVHEQHYRQVMAKLGEDAAVRPLSEAEGSKAFMVEELEMSAPAVTQEYPYEVSEALTSALTDAELLDSYNMPAKALEPLEKVLPQAPRDFRVNQRLASLYATVNRFADAAGCCDTLESVYQHAGHPEQAKQYREMAAKYRERARTAPPLAHAAAASAADVSIEAPPPPVLVEVSPQPAAVAEIDLSEEWETHAAAPVAEAARVAEIVPPVAEVIAPPVELPAAPVAAPTPTPSTGEVLEEIRFYISQGMWIEARAACARCESIAPGNSELAALQSQVAMAVTPEIEVQPDSDFGISLPSEPFAAPPIVTERMAPAKADVLDDFVSDLEDSLGSDFAVAATTARAAAPAAARPAAPSAPKVEAAPAQLAEAVQEEANTVLSDMFAEFKEDAESGAGELDDPETHYNLGVAFREMGLMDEAIGELQKVCHSIDKGVPFSQTMQAYTWLAQSLVDKGVPGASYKWYEKALGIATDEQQRLSLHYDLAAAYEAAGNRPSALQHFLEVYGSNIDYRDVAERIKALKS